MQRNFIFSGLLILLSHAAFANNSLVKLECSSKLSMLFYKINDLTPLHVNDNKKYLSYREKIRILMNKCPVAVYPIKVPSMVALNRLDFAILGNDVRLVRKLVASKKLKLDSGDALGFAAFYGDPRVLNCILNAGAPINSEEHAYTALMSAPGGVELNGENVKFLIDRGADIFHVDKYGVTALISAIVAKDVSAVKILLENGALSRRIRGQVPPLKVAKMVGNKEILDLVYKYTFKKR